VARQSGVRFSSPRPYVMYKDPDRQRQYQREWQAKRRSEWLLANGPCSMCSSWVDLEVHHINPDEKISNSVWSWSEEKRRKELAKCIVLCSECHKDETRQQHKQRRNNVHGTAIMFRQGCRCSSCRRKIADDQNIYRHRVGTRGK
jgi:5-methylcytosine-specific restriction endonuclease McrA